MLIIEFIPVQTFMCSACNWQAFNMLSLTCPSCGHRFTSVKVIFMDGTTLLIDADEWCKAIPMPPNTLG